MAIVGGGTVNIRGVADNGSARSIKSTSEGHLEVAIHAPRLPFGSVDVAQLYPVFQQDGVYGILASEINTTTSNGAVKGANNLLTVETASKTAGALATLQSRKRLRYRPGQGIIARFTAVFSAGIANTVQVAGVGTAESGYYFGYNGTSYGILWSNGGVREIQTLTISAGAGGAETITLRLNGSPFEFSVTSGNATSLAWQISQQTFAGWRAEQRGSMVVFLANDVGDKTGSFTLQSTGTAAGTFAQTKQGAAATDTWIPQADWNGDKLNGTGASGVTIDPTKGNIYQIDIQYLGFGAVAFKAEAIGGGGNNPDWVTVHTIGFPNSRTAVNMTQPSFPFTMAVYNTGTAAAQLSTSTASYAGFVAGMKRLTGPRHSFINTVTSSTSTFVPLFTLRNSYVYNDRANQSVVNILSASGAAKSNSGITTFYMIKNGTLGGTPAFGKHGDSSVLFVDTAATSVTFNNDDITWSATVSETGQFIFDFSDEIELQPGETMTFAVRSVTQTAVCVGQLNVREDQ